MYEYIAQCLYNYCLNNGIHVTFCPYSQPGVVK